MRIKRIVSLHLLFLLYSISGIISKIAAKQIYLSSSFFALYGFSLVVLALYSLLWQRILITTPLTTAFSNKGVTIVWGIIWGAILFNERINTTKVIASVLIISGIAIIGTENE